LYISIVIEIIVYGLAKRHSRHQTAAAGGGISATLDGGPGGGFAETAGFLLAKAGGRAIRDFNRALEPFGLRARHYSVLASAADHGGLSQRELGTILAIDPSAIVALVDDLEKAGLVQREIHPDDRRTRLVLATPRGRDMLTRAHPLAAKSDSELLAPLTAAERTVLLSLLRRITAAG
jgi:DNA-binding MarR family transcriptional regulator